MKHLILVAALALASGSAFAGELDNESSVINQTAMNGAVVVRVDARDNSAAVATAAAPANEVQAKALAQTGNFAKVAATNVGGELDHDGGSSSWYFYNGYNTYYYSYMYWYGNWYRPCYTYNYGYYTYYYYSNYWY
ncbi:hypothetical protein [Bdellovibrio sp. NC01]|uniref:hypothetical protein n=1 Tax=Bdellovibrio sp. NC01 TaxID=2220073 RepID=UPI0011570E67|nr:hypothetical protein [Bdellovibrio sp. NC01]QDK36517.1 hypothetical protein DOE51_02340 [Bdellovibrio sp. NC01]